MNFLVRNCKFGSSACVYTHEKTYLPTGRWWEDERERLIVRHVINSLPPEKSSAFMPDMFGLIDNRLAWASSHGDEMEDEFEHSKSMQVLREAFDIGQTTARIDVGRRGSKARSLKAFRETIENGLTIASINIGPGGSSEGGRASGGGPRNIVRGGRGQILQFSNEDEWESWIEERMNVNNHGLT